MATRRWIDRGGGKRFLGLRDEVTSERAAPQIIVVENWIEELKRLASVE